MTFWRELALQPKAVWWISLGAFVNRLGSMALPFLILFLVKDRGVPALEAAAVAAFFGMGAVSTIPFSGWIIDRFGRARVAGIAMFGAGFFCLLLPFFHAAPMLMGLVFLWAACTEIYRPASVALATDVCNPDRIEGAQALVRLASNAGWAVGPILGGVLAAYSYSLLFWIDGLTSILAAFTFFPHFAVALVSERPLSLPWTAWRETFRDRRYRNLLLAIIPVCIGFDQLESTLAVYVVKILGMSEVFFGTFYTVNTGIILAFEYAILMKTLAVPRGRLFAGGAASYAFGWFLLVITSTPAWLYVAEVFFTFGEIFLFAIGNSYVAKIAPARLRGSYLAFYFACFSGVKIISPPVSFFVLEKWGVHVLYGGVSFICAAAAVVLFNLNYEKSATEHQ